MVKKKQKETLELCHYLRNGKGMCWREWGLVPKELRAVAEPRRLRWQLLPGLIRQEGKSVVPPSQKASYTVVLELFPPQGGLRGCNEEFPLPSRLSSRLGCRCARYNSVRRWWEGRALAEGLVDGKRAEARGKGRNL